MAFPSGGVVGFKFMPTDEELVAHYLYSKVHGLAYYEDAVKDFDLYGNEEPWVVFDMFGGVDGEDLYFFTQLKRKWPSKRGSSRVSRRVGTNGGTWSAENSETTIFSSQTNGPIGFCKRLRYENGGLEHHGEWIMHEYSLDKAYWPNNGGGGGGGEYVLCRIRKNDRPIKKALKRRFSELELQQLPASCRPPSPFAAHLEQQLLALEESEPNYNEIIVEEEAPVADFVNVEECHPQMDETDPFGFGLGSTSYLQMLRDTDVYFADEENVDAKATTNI